jgi:hypothetical protein
MSNLRDLGVRGPDFGTLPKERLVVIHRRQRLADAMESDPCGVSAYCISQRCVLAVSEMLALDT